MEVVTMALQQIYSSSGEGKYPLSIKVRLIPDIMKLYNHLMKSKVDRLRNQQACFDKYITRIINWEIADLDMKNKKNGLSL